MLALTVGRTVQVVFKDVYFGYDPYTQYMPSAGAGAAAAAAAAAAVASEGKGAGHTHTHTHGAVSDVEMVLRGFDLTIAGGRTVAIVGESG